MKKILALLLAAALMLPFSCTKPDNPVDDGKVPDGGTENNGGSTGDTGNGETPEVQTYKPGDYYKVGLAEGIVVKVDESGTTGLLISLDETRAAWSTEYVGLIDQGMAFAPEDGAINSKLIKQIDGWKESYPAFAWCDSKNPKGLSSWYLPSTYELEYVYMEFDAVNAGLESQGAQPLSNDSGACYWTSVEGGAMMAYPFSFYYGEISSYYTDKKNEHHVRAMRKF